MNSKQLTLSSEPKKSYSRSLQRSTDVVIDSENNIRISAQCTKTIADNKCLELFRFSKLFIHLKNFFFTFAFFFTTKCFKDKLTASKLSGFKN
jgi:hypothetical protein